MQEPGRRSVLLVEDDIATRGMIARHLRNSGYEVTQVESAEEVIFAATRDGRRFDVVISDVHLPGTSGIDLASYLLMKEPAQAILLITGDPDEALARDALSRGPVSYLLKPFELFELDAALRQALMRHAAPAAESTLADRDLAAAASGTVLDDWVRFVDERSYAGAGHAERVARLATTLAECLGDVAFELSPSDLALAARMHELGRLSGPAVDPVSTAVRGAEMLADAGFPAPIVRAVRHLHERWDGTGGPAALSASRIPAASQVLAAADALDHYCSAWLQAGTRPSDAMERALGLVVAQQGALFSPLVVGAVQRQRGELGGILAEAREEQSSARTA